MINNKILTIIVGVQSFLFIYVTVNNKHKKLSDAYLINNLLNDYDRHYDVTDLKDYPFRTRRSAIKFYFNKKLEDNKKHFIWSALCEYIENRIK